VVFLQINTERQGLELQAIAVLDEITRTVFEVEVTAGSVKGGHQIHGDRLHMSVVAGVLDLHSVSFPPCLQAAVGIEVHDRSEGEAEELADEVVAHGHREAEHFETRELW